MKYEVYGKLTATFISTVDASCLDAAEEMVISDVFDTRYEILGEDVEIIDIQPAEIQGDD